MKNIQDLYPSEKGNPKTHEARQMGQESKASLSYVRLYLPPPTHTPRKRRRKRKDKNINNKTVMVITALLTRAVSSRNTITCKLNIL